MSTGTTSLTIDGVIARVTFSNPARHNAMSLAMWLKLGDIMGSIDDTSAIRVVVLRGEGTKSFVSGADISEFESRRSNSGDVDVYDAAVERAQTAVARCARPVIASIHGLCIGGGMGIALSCDLRYSTCSAKFRMPAARLGLGYSSTGLRRWVALLGAARAAEIFYAARPFDGVEAERIGFVQRAYDDAELDSEVAKIVTAIAENAPLTIRAAKLGILNALDGTDGEAESEVRRAIARCTASDDYVEGRRAFMEKRLPRFVGR